MPVLADRHAADGCDGAIVQLVACADHARDGLIGAKAVERAGTATVDGEENRAIVGDAEIGIEGVGRRHAGQFCAGGHDECRGAGRNYREQTSLVDRAAEVPIVRAKENDAAIVEAEARDEEVAQVGDAAGRRPVEEKGVRHAVRSGEEQTIARRGHDAAGGDFAVIVERHRVHVL